MAPPLHRRVVDTVGDPYSPDDRTPAHELPGDRLVVLRDEKGPWGNRATLERTLRGIMDGYQNRLTGIGDPSRDKTYGGRWNGPEFYNQFLTGWEMQERWRGSDLGARIVEEIPREMTRRGWTITIQPDEEKRKSGRTDSRRTRGLYDDLPPGMGEQPAPPSPTKAPGAVAQSQHVPGALPEVSDDNTALIEALTDEQERLGLGRALYEAACYERNYGGGGILIGVDDGEPNLTVPLDLKKVRRITHLTAFRGGWDGELIGWSYYCDPRDPKFGRPRTYQLRNLGVTVALPTPGEPPQQAQAGGKTGALITYVHESRLLLFPGETVSHWARVQMRGWGDSIWMRVNQILSQYDQSWNGIAILLSELGLPILSMENFSQMMAAEDDKGLAQLQGRATAMAMSMSIARTRIIDSKEKLERIKLDLGGVADTLREFALRLAAAADMPASRLLNQGKGGLGDTGKGDQDIFYDQIQGRQTKQILPVLRKFIALQFAASEGVCAGKPPPKRWAVEMVPLLQMSDKDRADYRYKIAQTDEIYMNKGAVNPEEVASTRYGGSAYNDGPIVLDLEGREALAKQEQEAAPEPQEPPPTPPDRQPPGPVNGPPAAPTQDAADFVTRNGRTKVRKSVSVIAAFNEHGMLLMGRRRDTGKFSLPGGHAEPGEDPLSTAVRELWEETKLHPRRIELVGTKDVGGAVAEVHISVFRALVEGNPSGSDDPDQEFIGFEWVDMSTGKYPPEIAEALHHQPDAVGPVLRRRR